MRSGESYIGLGSNQDGPYAQIRRALQHLSQLSVKVERVSSLYRTEPVDAPPQPWFFNAVAVVRSSLGPRELLGICQTIESLQGRDRKIPHGPRAIDLDLLLAGDVQLDSAELTLPHPRLHLRRFVLVPLVEIAPEQIHPKLGLKVRDLLQQCPDSSVVVRLRDLPIP